MLTVLFALIAIVLCFYIHVNSGYMYWRNRKVKYVKPKFMLGNMNMWVNGSFADVIKSIYKSNPENRYVGIFQFTEPTLFVRDPELYNQIMVKDFNHFINHRTFVDTKTDPHWNKILVARTGDDWRQMRATLSPSFTISKMKVLFQLIEEVSNTFLSHFEQQTNVELFHFELKDTCYRFATDVIATSAFGIAVDSIKDRENSIFMAGKELSDFSGIRQLAFIQTTIHPILTKIFKIKIVPERVANYISNLVTETIQIREEKNIIRPDMIGILLKAKQNNPLTQTPTKKAITNDDIISQALSFLLAGFENTSSLLTFLLYELAMNPAVQARLRAEIRAQPAGIGYDALQQMPYLDMVVSETLRKWPPAILLDRVVTQTYQIRPRAGERLLTLDEGLDTWFPVLCVHRDAKYFPEPDRFDPERFSAENRRGMNANAYVPFGSGPRMCVGSRFALLQAKLLAVKMVGRFRLVATSRTPSDVAIDEDQLNLRAKGDVWIGLELL